MSIEKMNETNLAIYNEDQKDQLKYAIKKVNELIIDLYGKKAIESERDDLCDIRWVLENKLKSLK